MFGTHRHVLEFRWVRQRQVRVSDRLFVLPGHEVEAVALLKPSEPENTPYALNLLWHKRPDIPSPGVHCHHGGSRKFLTGATASLNPSCTVQSRADLTPLGHNIRLSQFTWDPQLNAAKRFCICGSTTFIGDYFGLDFGGGYAYTSSVSTYDYGHNPSNYQQQIVARVPLP
jgi:hypothetical protein